MLLVIDVGNTNTVLGVFAAVAHRAGEDVTAEAARYERLVANPAPLRADRPWPRPPGPPTCPECSRTVREAPSPVRALAQLVITNALRDHPQMRLTDSLPF